MSLRAHWWVYVPLSTWVGPWSTPVRFSKMTEKRAAPDFGSLIKHLFRIVVRKKIYPVVSDQTSSRAGHLTRPPKKLVIARLQSFRDNYEQKVLLRAAAWWCGIFFRVYAARSLKSFIYFIIFYYVTSIESLRYICPKWACFIFHMTTSISWFRWLLDDLWNELN